MPPWEQVSFFQTPVETLITKGAGAIYQVAPADPNRVFLAMACPVSGSSVWVSTNPNVAANQGFLCSGGQPPLMVNWSWWGPFVGLAWYGNFSNGQYCNVWTISLTKWPTPEQGELGN
jgi:hypothetical protein